MKWRVEKKTYGFRKPFHIARQVFVKREVVEVFLGGEVAGLGEAAPLPGRGESNVDQVYEELQEFARNGTEVRSPSARFALDLARHDQQARLAQKPLWQHLQNLWGLEDKKIVLLNGTIPGDVPLISSAQKLVDVGFKCVKVKVGMFSPEQDIARIHALRAHFPDLKIRLDANGAWCPRTARRIIAEIAHLKIDYIEQPCKDVSDHEGLRTMGVHIALDESVSDAYSARMALALGSCDVLVLKPGLVGSFDELRDVVTEAHNRKVSCVFSSSLDVIGRYGAAHLARALGVTPACGLATGSWIEDGLDDPMERTEAGMIWKFSSLPGLGLVNERYV